MRSARSSGRTCRGDRRVAPNVREHRRHHPFTGCEDIRRREIGVRLVLERRDFDTESFGCRESGVSYPNGACTVGVPNGRSEQRTRCVLIAGLGGRLTRERSGAPGPEPEAGFLEGREGMLQERARFCCPSGYKENPPFGEIEPRLPQVDLCVLGSADNGFRLFQHPARQQSLHRVHDRPTNPEQVRPA